MKLVLFGSAAMKHWFSDARNPKDTDYLVESFKQAMPGIEYHDVTGLPAYEKIYYRTKKVVAPQDLLTIKLAHVIWPRQFWKHIADINFLDSKNIDENWDEVLLLREDVRKIRGSRGCDHNKSNKDFFNDHVKRVYEHDSLHEVVKYGDIPLFNLVKEDIGMADISSELFFERLSREQRFQCIREEFYVIALERWVIPEKTISLVAYKRAVEKCVTSLFPEWLADFVVENIETLKSPDKDYMKEFRVAYENRSIKEIC